MLAPRRTDGGKSCELPDEFPFEDELFQQPGKEKIPKSRERKRKLKEKKEKT